MTLNFLPDNDNDVSNLSFFFSEYTERERERDAEFRGTRSIDVTHRDGVARGYCVCGGASGNSQNGCRCSSRSAASAGRAACDRDRKTESPSPKNSVVGRMEFFENARTRRGSASGFIGKRKSLARRESGAERDRGVNHMIVQCW